jgi:type I restriction enzyme, S subunit
VLLERIRIERRCRWEEAELEKMKAQGKVPKDDNWKKKYKEPEPINTENLPELPDGWCWAGFETIATIASNLVSPENYSDYPHIAPDNIEKGSGKLLDFKTIQEDKVFSPKHLFYPGQILYSKIRPYLSKCLLINFQGLCSADMYPINSDIDTTYLFRYILSNIFLKLINKASGSRVVLPKANQKQVYSIPVPIAPFQEQKEIVRRIEFLFKLADNIEQQYQQAEIDLQTLNQSILAKAFRGELVPQDPNDEPASVLLERIRAERDKAKPKKSESKKKRSSKKQDKQLGIPGI